MERDGKGEERGEEGERESNNLVVKWKGMCINKAYSLKALCHDISVASDDCY